MAVFPSELLDLTSPEIRRRLAVLPPRVELTHYRHRLQAVMPSFEFLNHNDISEQHRVLRRATALSRAAYILSREPISSRLPLVDDFLFLADLTASRQDLAPFWDEVGRSFFALPRPAFAFVLEEAATLLSLCKCPLDWEAICASLRDIVPDHVIRSIAADARRKVPVPVFDARIALPSRPSQDLEPSGLLASVKSGVLRVHSDSDHLKAAKTVAQHFGTAFPLTDRKNELEEVLEGLALASHRALTEGIIAVLGAEPVFYLYLEEHHVERIVGLAPGDLCKLTINCCEFLHVRNTAISLQPVAHRATKRSRV